MEEKGFLKKYEIIVLISASLLGIFYWYGISKQNSTKNDCSKIADEKVEKTKFYRFGEEAEKARDYSAYYEQCLRKEGL